MAKRHRKKIGRRTSKSNFEYDTYHYLNDHENVVEAQYESEKFQYVLYSDYSPDVIITTKSGKKIYIECKGGGRAFDSAHQRKLIAVKDQHKDIDLRILFYRDNILRKGSSFKQSNWAEKHGFTYAIGTIPDDWLE